VSLWKKDRHEPRGESSPCRISARIALPPFGLYRLSRRNGRLSGDTT